MNDTSLIIVCGTLESGGAERVISILSTPFADTFDKVTLITWREAPHFYKIDNRVAIVSLPRLASSDNDFIKIWFFRKYIKNNRPNLVLSFLTIFNLFTLVSLIGINVPIIVAERNDPRFVKGGKLIKLVRERLYKRTDGILCQTKSMKEYFKGNLSLKTHIIYNPVILPLGYVGKALKTIKKKRIVSVGRLHPQKNQKLLINSFYEFHKTQPEYTLSIYGTGDLRKELTQIIATLNMDDFIELAGENKNVKDLILDAEVFIMTSDYEGMPNALIEAMCLGLPCISTKVSGAVDLIRNGENGLLVNHNLIEICNALAYIIEDKKFSMKIAKNAVEIYDQLLVDTISKLWVDYLQTKIKVS